MLDQKASGKGDILMKNTEEWRKRSTGCQRHHDFRRRPSVRVSLNLSLALFPFSFSSFLSSCCEYRDAPFTHTYISTQTVSPTSNRRNGERREQSQQTNERRRRRKRESKRDVDEKTLFLLDVEEMLRQGASWEDSYVET